MKAGVFKNLFGKLSVTDKINTNLILHCKRSFVCHKNDLVFFNTSPHNPKPWLSVCK